MISRKKDLQKTLESIQQLSILVVGDIMLDRYIWGEVERISPEAPVPVLEIIKQEDRLGGAGNVVRNLTNIGVKVTACGFVGEDLDGQLALQHLQDLQVQCEGIIADPLRPTTVKTRIIAQKQQVVRIDREKRELAEATVREKFSAFVDSQLESHQCVILSDYGKGVVSEDLLHRLSSAQEKGRLGLHIRPYVVDPHPRNYDRYRGMSVAKPNRKEAEAGSGIRIRDQETTVLAARSLLKRWSAEMMLVTLGEDGLCILEEGREPVFRDTHAREVFDVSGAGDTITALFSAALATGASSEIAGDLANIAAGVVVSEIGTVAVTKSELVAAIDQWGR